MNKTARYYVKWNNTGREQQMPHVLPPEISNKSWNWLANKDSWGKRQVEV